MKLLVTGATGFTGSFTVPLLAEHGFQIRCLARPSSKIDSLRNDRVEWVYGDAADKNSLVRAMRDVDLLVNIVSLGFGHAHNIVKAAESAGITRAIFISTTAIFTSLNASSKKVRLEAEQIIAGSAIKTVILRPTMIYGSRRDRNMSRLVELVRRSPVIPILGNGQYLQQPVYVGDVAQAILKAILLEQPVSRAYNIAGAYPLTYDAVVETIAELLGRRTLKVHIPSSPVIRVLSIMEKLHVPVPVKSEQVERLNEHKAFDYSEARQELDYRPLSFREGMLLELKEMGLYA